MRCPSRSMMGRASKASWLSYIPVTSISGWEERQYASADSMPAMPLSSAWLLALSETSKPAATSASPNSCGLLKAG